MQVVDKWVISNGRETFLYPDESKEENGDDRMSQFWRNFLSEQKEVNLLKDVLSRFTFSGKVDHKANKVTWYSVVKTDDPASLC